MEWWIYRDGEVSDRPLTKTEIREKEYIRGDTYVCRSSEDSWRLAARDPELADIFPKASSDDSSEDLELADEGSGARASPAFNVDHLSSPSESDQTEAKPDEDPGSDREEPDSQQLEDSPEEDETREQTSIIATSLWKRPVALLVDYGLFVSVFWIASQFYFREMRFLNSWNIIVGYLIFLHYLAVSNSELGGSSSIGKKLFGLTVKDEEGFSLSFDQAFWRYLILLLPFLLWSLAFTNLLGGFPDVVDLAFVTVAMFFFVTILYLYLFDEHRRTLHDHLSGTTVVEGSPRDLLNFSFWRPHLCFITMVFAACVYASWFFLAGHGGVVPLLSVQKSILDDPRVLATDIPVYGNVRDNVRGGKSLYLEIWVTEDGKDSPELRRRVIRTVLENQTFVKDFQSIRLGLADGIDYGLIQRMNYRSSKQSIEAWKADIKQP